ncbi:DTWD1-like protein [Mya arenaria]|uniref:tRNA-uridine aminocarboxypropyltransferase 1 n=1 Tax=Mya arenaria TaxID=6604 RepID=A0ABY7EA75_MYAAR|nr:DTWD1-like protein [Mya arenaria]
MEAEPFPELKIKPADFLNKLDGRSKCSKCDRSRKFYCYTCYLPVPEIKGRVPKVKLPIKVDIIKHPSEVDGKSTAVHAGVLAPDDVTIYTYPCIPDYDKDKVVVVFPCETSVSVDQLVRRDTNNPSKCESGLKRAAPSNDEQTDLIPNKIAKVDYVGNDEKRCSNGKPENTASGNGLCQNATSSVESDAQKANCLIERVVFIDSTWNQCKSICNDERLKGLQCVELKSEKTKFWRHQKNNPATYLSTIEAIYYFMREFHQQFVDQAYTAQYDNLLFFFNFMYKKIRNLYDGGDNLKAYKSEQFLI